MAPQMVFTTGADLRMHARGRRKAAIAASLGGRRRHAPQTPGKALSLLTGLIPVFS